MLFADEDSVTDLAATRWRDLAHDQRLGELIGALIPHLHAFAKETGLTEPELLAASRFLNAVGQMSTDKRNEFVLLSDILGLSMLVTLRNNPRPQEVSQATLLGPFYIPDAPAVAFGGRLPGCVGEAGTPLVVSGTVSDVRGKPIADAAIEIWQTDEDGVYEAQQTEGDIRYRATVRTDQDGRYQFRTVMPVDYPVPTDGPVGQLLARTDISEYRPAHIHFRLSAPGYETLTTHLFDRSSTKLEKDVVFGTRQELLVNFPVHDAGIAPNGDRIAKPFQTLSHNFILPAAGSTGSLVQGFYRPIQDDAHDERRDDR